MDDNLMLSCALTLCAFALIKLKKRRYRRFKIRPINRQRKKRGQFVYYQEMKKTDEQEFFKYTRMTVPVFEYLLRKLTPCLSRAERSDGISVEQRCIVTLQHLSQGISVPALAWTFNIGKTTVRQIIYEVCDAIWNELCNDYLKPVTTRADWIRIADNFDSRWNFPHCLGALDGKHIRIDAPAKSGSVYFNYKKFFSIVLLASCDSTYRFTNVDIGAYGSQSDGGIFGNSIFGRRLDENDFSIPEPDPLPNSNLQMPYFLVADEAFPLKLHIMRPYPGAHLTQIQKIFNYRLSRARQVIENTFGILVARLRILRTSIKASPSNVDRIVKALVVLHNYCQTELHKNDVNFYCPPGFVDSEEGSDGTWRQETEALPSVGRVAANTSRRDLYTMRNHLAEYLVSEQGQVPWQNRMIF